MRWKVKSRSTRANPMGARDCRVSSSASESSAWVRAAVRSACCWRRFSMSVSVTSHDGTEETPREAALQICHR